MDLIPEPAPNLRQLLAFYLEAGVDCALAEEPVDRLSEPDAPIAPAPVRETAPPRPLREMPAATPAVPRSEIAPPPEAAIAIAREAARTAPTLEALRALLENFEGCALKNTATRLVFADGNPQARIMFVGEAPGRDEDIEGLPFVGRSGKLLDRMIAAIGLDRSKAYIANVIPWRPPGNRTPTPQETQICLPFIQRQIELVNPGRAGDARQSLDANAAVDPRGHHEDPRQVVRLRHRHAHHPRHGDVPSGVSAALAVLQADVVAGSARHCEGAGAEHLRRVGKGALAPCPPFLPCPRWWARFALPTLQAPHHEETEITAPSAARWPSRRATAAGGRSPSIRRRAALPARGPETAARSRAAACLRCRRRARPRRRRSG